MINVKYLGDSSDSPMLLETIKFNDSRGYLEKFYWADVKKVCNFGEVKEVFQTFSNAGVIRAFHFQDKPKPVNKLITILKGSIREVTVDIRNNSINYGKYNVIDINENSDLRTVFIPIGYAHGYQVLSQETIIQYLFDQNFEPELDSGFSYNSFENVWLNLEQVVSKRDEQLVDFQNFKSKF